MDRFEGHRDLESEVEAGEVYASHCVGADTGDSEDEAQVALHGGKTDRLEIFLPGFFVSILPFEPGSCIVFVEGAPRPEKHEGTEEDKVEVEVDEEGLLARAFLHFGGLNHLDMLETPYINQEGLTCDSRKGLLWKQGW